MSRTPTLRTAALAASLLVSAVAPVFAQRQVLFKDLRTLVADDVVTRGDQVALLIGGGEMLVPAEAILEVRDYVPAPRLPDEQAAAAVPVDPGGDLIGPPPPRWEDRAGLYAAAVDATARKYKLDPALLVAVALTESRFDRWALSRKGAQGVMQLMPGTARLLRVMDVWDARENIEAGARWLRRLLDRFNGDLDLALAAYNAGEEAVKRYGGIPPYPETRDYVRRIRATLSGFLAAQRDPAA